MLNLNECIEIAKNHLGKNFFENYSLNFAESEGLNGVHVVKTNKEISITYQHLNDLFRGLTIVKEEADKEEFDITLNSRFDSVGYMIDLSRNGVMTLDELKKTILVQALMGNNQIQLYMEDTYELEDYPFFGYFRGSYSKKDLKEIAEYGNSFGVEIVPCIETLDHLERPFRWEAFSEIRDGLSNVMPQNEDSYKLIEAMVKTCRECFSCKEIHIGMDESFMLGVGNYIYKHGYHDRVELFCEHLAKVIDICKKYNFEPMIWSDMFFRLNDKKAEYYSCVPLPEKTIKLIPEGIGLVYWDYYHDDKKIYDQMIKNHLATNRKTYFAGGAWRWSGFAPSIHKSYEFNRLALLSSQENGLKNVFVTAWGDNGNECSFETTFLSLAQYSCFNYYDNPSDDVVDSLLKAVTGETMERMLLLDLPNMPDKRVLAAAYNPSKYLFYQDPLLGIFDDQAKANFSKNYAEFSTILRKAAKESPNIGYVYNNLANLCDVLILKVDLGVRIRKAYKSNDTKTLNSIIKKDIPNIIKRIDIFRNTLEDQWLRECRPFGFDVLDGRFGYLKQRLTTAANRLNNFVKGKIKTIDELEKVVLPYNGYDYEICWNDWSRNVAL